MSLPIIHLYRFGDFTLDADNRVLLRDGKRLSLTPKVLDTLLILVENSGRVVEKGTLMQRLWPDTFVEEANLAFNIQQLRKALGDDARNPRYIETVRGRGYSFIAEVEEVLGESTPNVQTSERIEMSDSTAKAAGAGGGITANSGTGSEREVTEAHVTQRESLLAREAVRPGRDFWKWPLALAAFALILIVGGWLLRTRLSASPQPSSGRTTLAVLPFRNLTGDDSQEYFSDGLTEEMITQLGSLAPQRLGVIAHTSVMQYRNSQKPLDQIGRELGAEYLLEGSLRRDSENVRITVQLIQVRDQTSVWTQQYDRQLQSLLALQREIGREVANHIQTALGNHKWAEPANQLSPSTSSYEAYEFWSKGQYFWNRRDTLDHAIEYFQRAVDKDPAYARAYIGLANCYALIGGYSGRPRPEFVQKARAAAQRALELDGDLAEAHTAQAFIDESYDWDWQASEKEFLRAIELNPNSALAHHWYAEHLAWRGRFDEALREIDLAHQLDPLSLIVLTDKGVILYYARQYDRAIEQFRAVREMSPNFPRTSYIILAYEGKEQLADARTDIEKRGAVPSDPHYWEEVAYAYGRSGQLARAQQAIEKLLEMNRRQELETTTIAIAYLGVGNKEQALAWLEKAYAQHSNELTSLKVDPRYDPLRDDPRFQDLLHRLRLD